MTANHGSSHSLSLTESKTIGFHHNGFGLIYVSGFRSRTLDLR